MPRRPLAIAAALVISAAAAAQTGRIEITDAWARATPSGAENGAVYLTMRSATADLLTGVTTSIAEKAELHSVAMDGRVMRMRELAAIDLPAGEPVILKPGGRHIMLVGLKQALQPGESVPLVLRFEKSGLRDVAATVSKIGAAGPEHQPSDGMHKQPGR